MGTVTDAQSKALAMTGAYVGAYNSQGNGIYGLYGYQYYINDAKYGSQLRLHYNTGVIETRTCKTGVWSDWQSYVTNSDLTQMACAERSNDTIWVGSVDRQMYLTVKRETKTLEAIFASGEKITFTGQ